MTSCEVWGSPISHSLSPALHSAAYQVLGLDWTYDRRAVDTASFDTDWATHGVHLRGVSLTMPLKPLAFSRADIRDDAALLTEAVNTLLPGEKVRGFNTDVGGLAAALVEAGHQHPMRVRILGAGATAASAIVAALERGAREIEVTARRPEAAAPLVRLAEHLGMKGAATPLDAPDLHAEVTISTFPVTVDPDPGALARWIERGGDLYDVTYGGWPGPLARAWGASGAHAHSGLGMLLHQAVRQVRVFVTGDVDTPLHGEPRVLAAMRHAVMGD